MKYSKEWLREDELQKMMSLPDLDEKYEIWMLLMYGPALRVSEAINVRVRDLDIQNRSIDIRGGKGYHETELRQARCDTLTLKRLKRFADAHKLKPNDFIMFSNKSKQVNRSHVYTVVNQIAHDAGIDKKIGCHTFRRSRAEHVLDRGIKLEIVSKFLRHRKLETTMKYLDVSVADVNREFDKIEDNMSLFIK